MNIIDDLKWRHACKAMNGEEVSQDKIDNILEAINLAPTSLGLQSYKVIVIQNKDLKQKIHNEACNQQPIVGCSHLVVFAAKTEVGIKDIDSFFNRMKIIRGKEDVSGYRSKYEAFVEKNIGKDLSAWLSSQTYIALGVACTVAATLKVDSVPIEGFDKAKLDEILSLKEKGYISTLILPLGYSDKAADWNAGQKKIRKDIEELVEVIK